MPQHTQHTIGAFIRVSSASYVGDHAQVEGVEEVQQPPLAWGEHHLGPWLQPWLGMLGPCISPSSPSCNGHNNATGPEDKGTCRKHMTVGKPAKLHGHGILPMLVSASSAPVPLPSSSAPLDVVLPLNRGHQIVY